MAANRFKNKCTPGAEVFIILSIVMPDPSFLSANSSNPLNGSQFGFTPIAFTTKSQPRNFPLDNSSATGQSFKSDGNSGK